MCLVGESAGESRREVSQENLGEKSEGVPTRSLEQVSPVPTPGTREKSRGTTPPGTLSATPPA